MRVEEVMTTAIKSCRAHDSMCKGARLLYENHCGVPVLDGEHRVVGMLGEHDLCRALATLQAPPSETPVRVAMTTPARTVMPEASIEQAHSAMRRAMVRWLVVVDGAQRLVGVLALEDLARHATRELEYECHSFRAEQVVRTFAQTAERSPAAVAAE